MLLQLVGGVQLLESREVIVWWDGVIILSIVQEEVEEDILLEPLGVLHDAHVSRNGVGEDQGQYNVNDHLPWEFLV